MGIALAALLAFSAAPVTAKASDDEVRREVHGYIDTPTATSVGTPPHTPGVQAHDTTHLGCVLPGLGVRGTTWTIDSVVAGREFELTADAGSWHDDFDIAFFPSSAAAGAACDGETRAPGLPHRDRAGDERSVVPDGATVALVTLVTGTPGAAFTYREFQRKGVKFRTPGKRRPTVVAILEPVGFRPYHYDFLGHQHPWNTDLETENDIDFYADPATYIPGYPSAEPVQLTIPQNPDDVVSCLAGCSVSTGRTTTAFRPGPDTAAWESMKGSTLDQPRLYRFPGTKVVGAIRFAPGDLASTIPCIRVAGVNPSVPGANPNVGCDNDGGPLPDADSGHGTKSASVAAGNIHGTCPECVVVLVTYDAGAGDFGADTTADAALEWLASQSWIDVISNSWAFKTYARPTAHPARVTRPATESGQTFVWGSGNGVDGTFVVPNQTYGWGYHGADWGVTVGAVAEGTEQPLRAGWPVDVASYGSNYPSAGGSTANGTGHHEGTSNATPVVAGTFAKTIQMGRDLLGDTTPGHHDGIVAEGEPRPCATGVASCPLADGVLTRAEVQAVVFGNVLPSAPRLNPDPPPHFAQSPAGTYNVTAAPVGPGYTNQGHGIVHGRSDPVRFGIEQRRFLDALRGAVGSFTRPPGERAWMTADSKCRQRLWGTWNGGYYTDGREPGFDPLTDQPAIALYAACTAIPQDALAQNLPYG